MLLPALLLAGTSEKSVTTVNKAPEAIIVSHSDGDIVLEGYVENLRGQVSDTNHSAEELEAAWYYGDDLICDWAAPDGGGASACDVLFSTDELSVRLEVRDPDGAGAFDEVLFSVEATDVPIVEILSPEASGVYYSDQKVTLEGLVSDNEDDPETLVVNWNSDIDGDLGVANEPNASGEVVGASYLSEGEHFLLLTAEDSTEKTGTANVTITVGPPNSPPLCEITSPITDSAGALGELVTFEGTASDVDVASDWLAVVWSSDKDGEIGTSTPNSDGSIGFAYSDLSVVLSIHFSMPCQL